MGKEKMKPDNPTHDPIRIGKCPYCGRLRPLGRTQGDTGPDRCIDCTFGPPMEYWTRCRICGSLEVNPEVSCWSCEQDKKRRRKAYRQAGGTG